MSVRKRRGNNQSLIVQVHQALMRATLDYGCAYMSAAESHPQKLDVEQVYALRIHSGDYKTFSVAAMQVEMGEQPLRI